MKIRNGYVSNSSSSSFIVKQDLTQFGVVCLKLDLVQKQKMVNSGYIKQEEINEDLYLTQFVYGDAKYDVVQKVEHQEYVEGQMSEKPRDYEYFNEYQIGGWNSVYLLKEHDEAKQMTFKQFVKYYKDSDLPQELLVNHTADGFEIKYIR